MSSATLTTANDNLVDLLASRRQGNDFLWVMSHDYITNCYGKWPKRLPQEIKREVLRDPVIQEMIQRNSSMEWKIEKILEEMCHTFCLRRAKFVAYMVLRIMKSVYQHIWVADNLPVARDSFYFIADSVTLQESLQKIVTQCPVLYLPTHRSYADFVLLSYLCFQMNLPLPTIAAGNDFLSLNYVASLLRSCGAFFIRRSFKDSNDVVYPQVFRSYVQQLVLGGEMPLECFIEGTRSRSGKSLWPKIGLLRTALYLFLTSRIPDLLLIPISICYDRSLEEDLYAKELSPPQVDSSGGKKPKETTGHLISGARAILAQDYGSVYIRFGRPISVRELGGSQKLRAQFSKVPLTITPPPPSKEESAFVENLALSIIKAHHRCSVISSFSIFSTVVTSELIKRCRYEEYHVFPSDMEFSFRDVLVIMDYLSCLIQPTNCAHRLLNISLAEDLHRSLSVHQNLLTLVEQDTLIIAAKNLVLTKLRVYSNQYLQLVAETALVLYSPDYQFYRKLEDLLRNEFILEPVDMHRFESLKASTLNLPEQVRSIFTSHINYLVVNYSRIINWFISRNLSPLESRKLIRQIQSDLKTPMDLVQNFVQLAIVHHAIGKTSDSKLTLNHQDMQYLHILIESIVNEKGPLQSYCGAKPKL